MRGGWRASFIQQSQVVPSSCHCFHYENYLIKHSYLILLHRWLYSVHDHKMLLLMLNSSHMPPSLPPPPPPLLPPQKEKQQQQKKYFNTSCFKLQYLGNTNLMWNKKTFLSVDDDYIAMKSVLLETQLRQCGAAVTGSSSHQSFLFHSHTHIQSRHTRLKKKNQSLFRDIWFLLKWCGSAVTPCGKIAIFYCAAIFPAAVGHCCR